MKRFSLNMTEDLFLELDALAAKNNTTVTDIMRRFVKLGLIHCALTEAGGRMIIEEKSGEQRELKIIM